MFTYLRLTRTATYGLLATIPLLIGYECLIVLANARATDQVRVSADVWTKSIARPLLELLGVHGNLGLGLVVLVMGLVLYLRDRIRTNREADERQEDAEYVEDWDAAEKRRLRFRPGYLVGMVAEGLVLAVILASGVSMTVRYLMHEVFAGSPAMMSVALDSPQFWQYLALSLGAGLYEEFVFRLLLMVILTSFFTSLFRVRTVAYIVAALISAAAFSAIHYIGPYGDEWRVVTFVYRFIFGLALQGLMLARGFAVAAWTHALYDVLVICGAWDS